MAEAIAWDLAERTAVRVGGDELLAQGYRSDSLQDDFARATTLAETLVGEATGLRSLVGPARAVVTDRAGWVRANVASFRRLVVPLTDRLMPRIGPEWMTRITGTIAGAQLGVLLGWMSTRVLGQYDLLLTEDDRPEDQDIVYYVGPNVIGLERRFGFPPAEFRLWLALHEVTHRAQFTGVPWLRDHFVGLVRDTVAAIDPDPRRLLSSLRRVADDVRAGRNPLQQAGLLGIVAGPEQLEVLGRVQGLMSLLEGHGDVTMDRAGAGQIPSAERFARVLRERRASVSGPAKLLQQLLGLESKLRQYEDGERFVAAVEAAGGPALFARVWEGADWLPGAAEILDPQLWISRATAPAPEAAS